MNDNKINPFDPSWYNEAFDKDINPSDQLDKLNSMINEGYILPDKDGARSSIIRNNAILNNTFNENDLRESLKDIYLNTSHKLVASNHDNTHFFKWNGYMSDMTMIPNTNLCEFKIPCDTFVSSKEKDAYKLSQYYRKWIKVEDILNNWNIFKWHCMLFINQRIYSEYELRIDDHEVIIRFKYNDHWVKNNYPVYIYKFDTNAQCRVFVSRELCKNQWNWKMPIEYISDKRVINSKNIMVTFNKISDQNIRNDGLTKIDVLGDNIEFLKIENGYVDLSSISRFNKIYIESESTEWLWMSIIVPKFFHEYPILLPTDVIYRPYISYLKPVSILQNNLVQHVKTELDGNNKQLYIDVNTDSGLNHWKEMIRPIVLSDSFDNNSSDDLYENLELIKELKKLTIKAADIVEEFRFFIKEYTTDNKFNQYIDKIIDIMSKTRETHNLFLNSKQVDLNKEYEYAYKRFLIAMEEIREDNIYSDWFNPKSSVDKDIWNLLSTIIIIPRELSEKYNVMDVIDDIGSKKVLWEDIEKYSGQLRFQRPIEENDFWTFEYYSDDAVWRPYPLKVKRNFPDVYLLEDDIGCNISNRVFKTFFFYSDTMNVLKESTDIVRPTASWDEDMEEYHIDQQAIYRDIFMEKFYWMGIKSIYKGILFTNSRWELIEYIIDNESYDRFNNLFLHTMDPYFKLGLVTYMKSDNFGFPFDDAISKMKESINNQWLGYKKVTNFEVYLNKNWVPSYFDYVIKILDNWDYGNRLVKRPRPSFDIYRLYPILLSIQKDIFNSVKYLNDDIEWVMSKLERETYNLNIQNIMKLKNITQVMVDNIKNIISYTDNIDLDTYSIDDVNRLIDLLKSHDNSISSIEIEFNEIYDDVSDNNVYISKRSLLEMIVNVVNNIPDHIRDLSSISNDFDMNKFILSINDLRSYLTYDKNNPDDNSIIGYINKFNDNWSNNVKECRNKLFLSTVKLSTIYSTSKSYTDADIEELLLTINEIKDNIHQLRESTTNFWVNFSYNTDQTLIDKFDYSENLLTNFSLVINKSTDMRSDLVKEVESVKNMVNKFYDERISETEKKYRNDLMNSLNDVVLALSYIAGINDRNDAIDALNNAKKHILKWTEFINIEEDVFTKLLKFVSPPVGMLEIFESHQEIFNTLIEYMDTVNISFVKDTSVPTYSDIYKVLDIEIISNGFNNDIGDMVFIDGIGSYVITEIGGNVSKATLLEPIGYRNTCFRNPMNNVNIYDTITNGNGVGITVKPLSINHISIINDEIFMSIMMRVQNAVYMLSKYIETLNPYNNRKYGELLDEISSIHVDWDNIIDKYENHMSVNVRNYTDDIVKNILHIKDPSLTFISIRDKIDLYHIMNVLQEYIFGSYEYVESIGKLDDNFFYYDEKIRLSYKELSKFYGNGTSWSDTDYLKGIIEAIRCTSKLFHSKILSDIDENSKLNTLYESLMDSIIQIRTAISDASSSLVEIKQIIRQLNNKIENTPRNIQKDVWYKLGNIDIADGGKKYKRGDIIEIVPKLPIDINGNEVIDMKDIIMADVILLKVLEVDNGIVTKIKPLMEYAVPYKIWGIRNTISRVGSGSGLIIDIKSSTVELSDSNIFKDEKTEDNDEVLFDDNDMFVFKFENSHELDIQYEVFLGGKQITDFFKRKLSSPNPLYPRNIDVIYINANDIIKLQTASMHIPAEHYFMYKLDSINIKDPGAGYSLGQEVFVGAGDGIIKLKVTGITNNPYKGIASLDISDKSLSYNGENVSSDNCEIITDSLNNIDDEFNNGYYDLLPSEGISKPAVNGLDPDEYIFISKRFDNLINGDRNATFMYPDVIGYSSGDPDYNWYQGSRIDNSQHPMTDECKWNGIMNVIPPIHPFIPDNRRVPTDKPIKGEYQLISRQAFRNSIDIDVFNEITKEKVDYTWENEFDASDIPPYISKRLIEILDGKVRYTWEENGKGSLISDECEMNKETINTNWLDNGMGDIEPPDIVSLDFSIRNEAMIDGDLQVSSYSEIPKHINEWGQGAVNKTVIVESDETHDGHRMLYRIRTFVAEGYFVYDDPEIADMKWNTLTVDWMNIDSYMDYPSKKAQYPSAPWHSAKRYRDIQREINDNKHTNYNEPEKVRKYSYIHNITLDDISVFNWTTKSWEDLHDDTLWKLDVINDTVNNKYGFTLTYLEEGTYTYDMSIYLNKTPESQTKNSLLKRNAIIDVSTSLVGEVKHDEINTSISVSRHLRIRKLFPYYQKESFVLGYDENKNPLGYEMNFKLSPYNQFRNEIHLEDIKVFNKTANRFENIFDRKMFEIRFKDPKSEGITHEVRTDIVSSVISLAGEGFVDGSVWAWNQELGINVFGDVKSDVNTNGHIIEFIPRYCLNPPSNDITLEFDVYQNDRQTDAQKAVVVIEFNKVEININGDGYIHNVNNRLAPVTDEIKLIVQYNLDGPGEYDVIIDKTPRVWDFVRPNWLVSPVFHISGHNIPQDRLYISINGGRFPLINPATGKPTMIVNEVGDGTDVTFLTLYRRYEHIKIHSVPYPMRSVYTQRYIPRSGYVDLFGKLNKPLNKKYYEFWVNGKLMYDEVTIISPTKLIFHGLTSLKNLEIIEVNRDPVEYFSDSFLKVEENELGRPSQNWDYKTYIDGALEGTLEGDNYTSEEQEYLLSPIWEQVDEDHPEYKNYPPNVDNDPDILTRVNTDDYPISELENPTYQFIVTNAPTIEGHSIVDRTLSFKHFDFKPVDAETIVKIMNEEWHEEIENDPYFPEHVVITDNEWYGMTTRLYDEYGILVNNLDSSVYKIYDNNLLKINTDSKLNRIIKNQISYDLD